MALKALCDLPWPPSPIFSSYLPTSRYRKLRLGGEGNQESKKRLEVSCHFADGERGGINEALPGNKKVQESAWGHTPLTGRRQL